MSTNNPELKFMVKSLRRKLKPKSQPKVSNELGLEVSVSTPQQAAGRPRLENKGQVVNQIIAERRRQGAALFLNFAQGQGVRNG